MQCPHCKKEKDHLIVRATNLGKPCYWCSDCNREARRAYRLRHPEVIRAIVARYEAKNPEKKLAWNKVNRVPLKPCIICKSEDSVRHHPSYAEPKKVIFLCHRHHWEVHNSNLSLKML